MHMEQAEELMARLAAIRERMTQACEGKYPLPKVLAVTETHTPEEILPLRDAGIREIGENRVQGISRKTPFSEGLFPNSSHWTVAIEQG